MLVASLDKALKVLEQYDVRPEAASSGKMYKIQKTNIRVVDIFIRKRMADLDKNCLK